MNPPTANIPRTSSEHCDGAAEVTVANSKGARVLAGASAAQQCASATSRACTPSTAHGRPPRTDFGRCGLRRGGMCSERDQDSTIIFGGELVGQFGAPKWHCGVFATELQQHRDQAGFDLHPRHLHRLTNRQLEAVVVHDAPALLRCVVEVLQILDVGGRIGQTFGMRKVRTH